MVKYAMAIDSSKCMACHNCFMACKDEHCGFDNMPVAKAQPHTGHSWMRIDEWERGDSNKRVKTATVPTPCSHCENPACVSKSSGAAYVRPDGIVILDPEKAKGKRDLVDSCPIGAIYWNEELALPQKCTMCAHLLDKGFRSPRCVEVCPNGALIFGDVNDPQSEVSKAIAGGRVTQLSTLSGQNTGVFHLNIPSVFLAGSVYLPGDEPCVGGSVSITDSAGNALTACTNDFGDFEFEDLVKNEKYSVRISYGEFAPVELDVTLSSDKFVGEIYLA